MNNIINKFLKQARMSGKTPFFAPDIATLVVNECKRNNVPIHGIDAVKITDVSTQPFMEHSIDYSTENTESVWDDAVSFIQSKQALGLYFEIVIPE